MASSGGGDDGGVLSDRVILHLDVDCFYAQVESQRLGLGPSVPLAVRQWDGLIAVNYAARAFGVRRGDRAEAAQQKCPQIKMPHVDVLSSEPVTGTVGADRFAKPDPRSAKVSLDRYRAESVKIFSLLAELAPLMERVSIDECYVDVTAAAAANAQLRAAEGADMHTGHDVASVFGDTAAWVATRSDPLDSLLLEGAALCAALRSAVQEATGFTMSAGIAHTKLVAKLASARHKPNRQTIVPRRAVPLLMASLPLRELRGLGGKLGEQVQGKLPSVSTAADLAACGAAQLCSIFGDETGERRCFAPSPGVPFRT